MAEVSKVDLILSITLHKVRGVEGERGAYQVRILELFHD